MDKLVDLFKTEGRANRAWYFWHIILDDLAIFTGLLVFIALTVVTGTPLFVLPAITPPGIGPWDSATITMSPLQQQP